MSLIALTPFKMGKYITALDPLKFKKKTPAATGAGTVVGFNVLNNAFMIVTSITPQFQNNTYIYPFYGTDFDTFTFSPLPGSNYLYQILSDAVYSPKTGLHYLMTSGDVNSNSTQGIATSSDGGATWKLAAIALPAAAWWPTLALDDDNDTMMICASLNRGQSVNYTYRSLDRGITWTRLTAGSGIGDQVKFHKKSKCFVKLTDGGNIWYSSNVGTIWSLSPLPAHASFTLTLLNEYLIARNSETTDQAYFSDDGFKTYTSCNLPSGYVITNIIYGAGLYIAFTNTASAYFTSNDLVNWTPALWPSGMATSTGMYLNGKFLFLGAPTSFSVYTV